MILNLAFSVGNCKCDKTDFQGLIRVREMKQNAALWDISEP